MKLLLAALGLVAQGDLPKVVQDAMRLSQLTAIWKESDRVRGTSAGDTLRRNCREVPRPAVRGTAAAGCWPSRYGTDGLVHLARALLESDPAQTILCIDGVGALDHVSRSILPFVRFWYFSPSEAVWAGSTHVVSSAEGGEQGDALMQGLFCIALAPAFEEIQNRLAPGDLLAAYTLMTYTSSRVQSVPVQHTTWFAKS